QYVQAGLEFARLSYSNPGTPTHNPGQESFFGRFKDDWKDEIAQIETFDKLEKFVRNKIKYYIAIYILIRSSRTDSPSQVAVWGVTTLFLTEPTNFVKKVFLTYNTNSL
ncbi:MAG: integrase core domain-containing protein, partial [Patescibacteria group bacterium]|nr:integrase core domain-containing protein [Patescibacteria group bacterium]